MKWKITPRGLLIFTCVFYFIFGILMIQPVNLGVPEHGTSTYGKLDRHILRVWRMAYNNAKQPFDQVKDHALFHKRSPGLFKFVAEISARLGATSPIPLQIILIFLVILGIIAQYTWLKEYFQNDVFPVVSLLFILATHVWTYFGITIHQQPYDFAFFNFTMLFLVKYINTKKTIFFVLTWFCYFYLCQNYYMYWISAFILMVGIQYFAGQKIIHYKNFILGLAPVLTVVLLMFQLSHVHGSFDKAIKTLKGSAKARILDDMSEGVGFKKKMQKEDWIKYPLTVSARAERYYYVPGILFLLLGWILLRLRKANQSTLNYRFFYFLIPAGLSWYLLMFQHTSVHQDTGVYSFFLWMIFYCYFFTELHSYIQRKYPNQALQKWLKYTWVFILIYGLYGFGHVHFIKLVGNTLRFVNYSQTLSKAKAGDKVARLELLANKYFYTYSTQSDEWIENLNSEIVPVESNVTLIDFTNTPDASFVTFKTEKNYTASAQLLINGKKFKFENPNEPPEGWKKRKYVVLKLRPMESLKSFVIQ